MAKDITRILVVEDNASFAEAAGRALNHQTSAVDFVRDYDDAISMIELEQKARYNGAIVDCFFPRKTGSGDRTLGEHAIKRLIDPAREQRMAEYEKALADSLDYTDPELRKLARYLGFVSRTSSPGDDIVVRALKRQAKTTDKATCSYLQKNNMFKTFRGLRDFRDCSTELRAALEKDEANQALGILVAEECKYRNIPVVLATSTHHHDALTQPIQDYCGKNGLTLIDCEPGKPNEKATPEFWQRAYEALVRKM